MMTERTAPEATVQESRRYGWASVGVAILLGLFYAYDLFQAISNVVGLSTDIATKNTLRDAAGTDLIATPWPLLVIDLLVPPVIYVVAFLLGRRRAIHVRAALFVVGLIAVSAISLSLVALAFQLVPLA